MQYHIPHRTIFFRTTAMLALATALLITALPTRGQETLPIATKEALQRKIQEKTKELEQINKEISSTKATLNSIAKRRRSLQRELAILQNNERKLALDIQSDRISIQKLNLEIQSINLDIAAIEEQLHDKKEAIGDLFRKIQRTDQVSPMMLFLKSNTLADGVAELKALQDLNARLSVDVATLFSLQQSLAEKLRDLDAKRRDATLHKQNLEARKALIADQKEEQRQLIQETKQKEEIYEARVAELEKKQEEIGRAIEEIEHQLRATFDPTLLPLKRPGVLAMPVRHARISQKYGATRFARRAYRTKFHNGVDLAASIGTPVFAADDGIVLAADNNDRSRSRWGRYQYGKYILIQHDNNLATLYAHLSRQLVKKGDEVKRGQLIGYSGNTGYSTGAHLHFGVYWAPSVIFKKIPPARGLVPVGVTVNPLDYLPL